jgi:hypothetical protein
MLPVERQQLVFYIIIHTSTVSNVILLKSKYLIIYLRQTGVERNTLPCMKNRQREREL